MPSFDPWNDAAALARHLRREDGELLVVVGAEAWCPKCHRLKPLFEAMCARTMPSNVSWMWLDLEDHAEFLSGFIPPDLPLLLRWRRGVCVQAAVVEEIDPEAPAAQSVRLRALTLDEAGGFWDAHTRDGGAVPALWEEFSAGAWTGG